MALKLQSADFGALSALDAELTHQAYNALDSAVTMKVHHALRPKLADKPHALLSYRFVRAMQGPALDMMSTGIAVNQRVRADETTRYQQLKADAQRKLDALADAVWGPEHYEIVTKTKEWWTPTGKRGQPLKPRERTVTITTPAVRPRGLNAGSSQQLLAFFNTALKCPIEHEVRKTPTGSIRTPTANGKALRKWMQLKSKGPGVDPRDRAVPAVHFAAPFAKLVLFIKDCDEQLEVLNSRLDPDGRMHCSYNPAGTENARWSSSKSCIGTGRNMQNVEPRQRRMFCADDGQVLVSTDLEQAESRLVAALVWQATGNTAYWDACLSGDLHTTVARMSWPELPWTDDPKFNRAIADQTYPGLRFSYRDVAKRIGHGSNYRGSAFGIALAIGIPVRVVEDFQRRYFGAFPSIQRWHESIVAAVLDRQYLDTPLARRRWFFGRPNDDSTIREAIAYIPQSTIGELLNLVLLNCWLRSKLPASDPRHLPIQILLQNHDAFLFQTSASLAQLPAIIDQVNQEFNVPIPLIRGNEVQYLTIPGEFVTGWNWAYESEDNPDGLRKWRGHESRRRTQPAATAPGDWLDRPLSRIY